MKRIISVLLMFMIIASITPVSASETDIEYFTIPVEYSDNVGNIEYLDIMVKNNNVYVNARMLAERMGFTYSEHDEKVVFTNSDPSNGIPISFTSFSLNSTKVEHRLFNSIVTSYEGPFTAQKNDKGSWVPFEYSLLLNNSGMMITDEALLIDIPTKRIIDLYQDVMKYRQKYQFTWEDDFGYTEKDVDTLGKSSHLVNLFSGLLSFDGASWVSLFQQFAGSYESYDKKYGEDFATLLCTESDKELQETIDKIELMVDTLDEDGQLGGALSSISGMKESQISNLYETCEAALKNFKNGNSPLVTYNRTYQALETSLDKQTWFSHVGENVLEVQKGLSSGAGKAFTLLDISSKLLKVCGYALEFQHQDEFTVEALTAYLEKEKDGEDRLEQMKKSMLDYSKSLSTNVGQYTFQQFQNHIDEWIDSGVDISSQLGSQASIALFAWNLASNTIPFISNGLSSADSFELALYSGVFQDNAFLNYQDKRESIFSNDANITAENLYELTQYCYICLKSCYVTREAALASLANKSESVKEKIQPLIDEQNNINKEIAKILVELKGANATNEGGVYGFLPSDNQKYLKQYDDSHIVSWAKLKGKSSGATTQEVKPQADTGDEKKIDEEKGLVSKVVSCGHNAAIINKSGDLFISGQNDFDILGYDGNPSWKFLKFKENVRDVYIGADGNDGFAIITKDNELLMWNYSYRNKGFVPILQNVDSFVYTCLFAATYTNAAVTKDGKLYMWGEYESPDGTGKAENEQPELIMTDVKQVSINDTSIGVVTTNGNLIVWGNNDHGQLGTGNTDKVSTSRNILSNISMVSIGEESSAAIDNDGNLYTWGANRSGELANGSTDSNYYPTIAMTGVKDVVADEGTTYVIDKSGKLYSCGSNFQGALGIGALYEDVPETKELTEIMENVVDVSAMNGTILVLTASGDVYGFGNNQYGQLGVGDTIECTFPKLILNIETYEGITTEEWSANIDQLVITPDTKIDLSFTQDGQMINVTLTVPGLDYYRTGEDFDIDVEFTDNSLVYKLDYDADDCGVIANLFSSFMPNGSDMAYTITASAQRTVSGDSITWSFDAAQAGIDINRIKYSGYSIWHIVGLSSRYTSLTGFTDARHATYENNGEKLVQINDNNIIEYLY